MSRTTRITAVLAIAAMPLVLSACGSSAETTPAAPEPAMTSMAPTPSETMAAMTEPFGAACSAVPADGAGSFSGMAKDPVATAASNNPVLSTLVTAVTAAGLGDTLNSAEDITVFAPTNDAFTALDPATLKAALDDPKGLLTKVLTNHVVPGKLAPEALAGDHKTLGGGTITVTGSGEAFKVGEANVVCGNVMTANATVYIIDAVLLPAA